MFRTIKALASDRRGVTTIEYGIIAVAVCIAAVTVLMAIGVNLTSLFGSVAGAFPT